MATLSIWSILPVKLLSRYEHANKPSRKTSSLLRRIALLKLSASGWKLLRQLHAVYVTHKMPSILVILLLRLSAPTFMPIVPASISQTQPRESYACSVRIHLLTRTRPSKGWNISLLRVWLSADRQLLEAAARRSSWGEIKRKGSRNVIQLL